jgi:hypothetical protein
LFAENSRTSIAVDCIRCKRTSYVARAFVRLDLLYVILIKIIFIDSRL